MPQDNKETIEYLSTTIKGTSGPLFISGSGSRLGFGEPVEDATRIDASTLSGVIAYEPSELWVTVAAGTSVTKVIETLEKERQTLCGDPPQASGGTIGGAYACGISGPRMVGQGMLREHILGCQLINGDGTVLRFGGTLIKNVAGYDITRLMVGALGTLGLMTELTLRVRSLPEGVATIETECSVQDAAVRANSAVAKGLPVVASRWSQGVLALLLEGSDAAVSRGVRELGGDKVTEDSKDAWARLREHDMEPFKSASKIWLCKLPPLAELQFDDLGLVECLGARRWFFDDAPKAIRNVVAKAGGSATLYRRPKDDNKTPVFPAPPKINLMISKRIKNALDPRGVLNPGRLGFM